MNVERVAAFDEMIDDYYPEVVIGDLTFSPSDILAALDPVAYNCHSGDYLSELEGDEEEDEDETL